jgi:hypothetical protein
VIFKKYNFIEYNYGILLFLFSIFSVNFLENLFQLIFILLNLFKEFLLNNSFKSLSVKLLFEISNLFKFFRLSNQIKFSKLLFEIFNSSIVSGKDILLDSLKLLFDKSIFLRFLKIVKF